MMVGQACSRPALFQSLAGAGDAGARFARQDHCPDGRFGEVDALVGSGFGEVQGITWSATDNGGSVIEDGAKPGLAAHAASRQTPTTQSQAGFEGQPEAEERP